MTPTKTQTQIVLGLARVKGYSTVPTELWTHWKFTEKLKLTEFLRMKTSRDIVSCYPVNCMSLDLAWKRNPHSVGWRSDYEGHWSKGASKEFKILFIGIVYKAKWKAMKKKAFIQLLFLPTFLHLRMRPKVHLFSSAIRRRIWFFTCCGNTSWTKKSI